MISPLLFLMHFSFQFFFCCVFNFEPYCYHGQTFLLLVPHGQHYGLWTPRLTSTIFFMDFGSGTFSIRIHSPRLYDFILRPSYADHFSFASSGLCTFTPHFCFPMIHPFSTSLVLSATNQGHSDILDWTILSSPSYSSLAPMPRLGRFA